MYENIPSPAGVQPGLVILRYSPAERPAWRREYPAGGPPRRMSGLRRGGPPPLMRRAPLNREFARPKSRIGQEANTGMAADAAAFIGADEVVARDPQAGAGHEHVIR